MRSHCAYYLANFCLESINRPVYSTEVVGPVGISPHFKFVQIAFCREEFLAMTRNFARVRCVAPVDMSNDIFCSNLYTHRRLQAQLSSMQREFCRREALQQSRYETVITRLAQEVTTRDNIVASV